MRVALFSSTIEPKDGYGNITYELTRSCTRRESTSRCFFKKPERGCRPDGTSLLVHCALPKYVYRIFERNGPGYFRTFDVSSFDVVHDLFSFPYCIPAARSAKKYGKPLVMGAQGTHGVRPLTYRPERWLLKNASARPMQLPYRVHIRRNESSKRRRKTLRSTSFITASASTGSRRKPIRNPSKNVMQEKNASDGRWVMGAQGHDLVLRALPDVLKKHPNVMYSIVGDGNARTDLEALTKELGMTANVDFAGRKSGDDLVAYFQACDIYVHTPRVVDKKQIRRLRYRLSRGERLRQPIVATDAGESAMPCWIMKRD